MELQSLWECSCEEHCVLVSGLKRMLTLMLSSTDGLQNKQYTQDGISLPHSSYFNPTKTKCLRFHSKSLFNLNKNFTSDRVAKIEVDMNLI